jgi:hypothetical protein
MGRIWLAFRSFFAVLFYKEIAGEVGEVFAHRQLDATAEATKKIAAPDKPAPPKPVKKPVRSDAVTLLATLQREARFIDFIKEPIDSYADAQIGAAVRDVHRDCCKVLERIFQLQPVLEQAEGSNVDVPPGFDAGRYRLSGNVQGEPPFHGRLVHPGWMAGTCQVPEWSGTESALLVIAPAEVELP